MLEEWFGAMFELTPTWPNFSFDQLFLLIKAIMTRYDSLLETSWVILSNILQLNLISLLDNFSYELEQILTRYDDFLEADEWFWEMLEPTPTWLDLTFGQLFIWVWANSDQIWVILSNVWTDSNLT